MPIRLVLADDHPIMLDGLCQVCADAKDMQVVARCINGVEALAAVRTHRPDVLVIDLAMPGLDGLSVIRQLHDEPNPTRVVVLTAAISDEQLLAAARLGVRGVVLKELAPALLLRCIRTVAAGGQWVEHQVSVRALDALLRQQAGVDPSMQDSALTPRELELVRFVVTGMKNKDIADRLEINEGTVKAHLFNVYKKLGVTSRVQMAMRAKASGLV